MSEINDKHVNVREFRDAANNLEYFPVEKILRTNQVWVRDVLSGLDNDFILDNYIFWLWEDLENKSLEIHFDYIDGSKLEKTNYDFSIVYGGPDSLCGFEMRTARNGFRTEKDALFLEDLIDYMNSWNPQEEYFTLFRYEFWMATGQIRCFPEYLFIRETYEYGCRYRRECGVVEDIPSFKIGRVKETGGYLELWLEKPDDQKASGMFTEYCKVSLIEHENSYRAAEVRYNNVLKSLDAGRRMI